MRCRRGVSHMGGVPGVVLIAAGVLAVVILGAPRRRPRPAGDAAEQTCLGNIKRICTAIQMYLADNDGVLPPTESRQEVIAYFSAQPGISAKDSDAETRRPRFTFEGGCPRMRSANPYLKWPVILESYLDDREVWRCPSARLMVGASFINGGADWLAHLQEHEGRWGIGARTDLCIDPSYPPGWGGDVTDSLTQGRLAAPARGGVGSASEVPAGVFVQSIAVNSAAAGLRAAEIRDPANFVICADGGAQVDEMCTGTLAYPDLCALECANEVCGWADWEECTWAADCGLYNHAPKDGSFLRDPSLRRPYARHRGGVHIGFLDGHASWIDAEAILAQSPSKGDPERGRLRGYGPRGPTSDCRFAEKNPGVPTLY